MKERLLYFLDRLLILHSLVALCFSIFFLITKEYYISVIPYIGESLFYLVLKLIFKNRKSLIIFYTTVNSFLILAHIIVALTLMSVRFFLIGHLSLLHGVTLISTIFAVYVIDHYNKLKLVFTVYLVGQLIFAFLFRPIFEKYEKVSWINTCFKNQAEGNIQLGISKQKTKGHCKCVYEKLINRYNKMGNFPSEENLSRKDQIEIFNCTVDFLMPDSVNKDSLKRNVDFYLTE